MTDIIDVSIYGQSHTVGYGANSQNHSLPAVTTVALDPANVVSFSVGARVRPNGDNENALNPATLNAYAGLRETQVDVAPQHNSETPCSGMAYWLKDYIAAKIHASSNGRGGYKVSQLNKGTQPYANLLSCMTRKAILANNFGLTYKLLGLSWMQGEGDENEIDAPLWRGLVEQMRLDMMADLGLTYFPFFIDQAVAFWIFRGAIPGQFADYNGLPQIPLIQLQLHEDNPETFRIVTPAYFLNTIEQAHFFPTDTRRYGEYWGRAWKEHIFDRMLPNGTVDETQPGWDCLRPISITRVREKITATFNNTSPLAFDTTNTPEVGSMGFCVNVNGRMAPIANVYLSGAHDVVINLRTPAPRGDTMLDYAYPRWNAYKFDETWFQSRGNLRDTVAPPSRFGYQDLWKWCVHFSKPVTDLTPAIELAFKPAGDTLLMAPGGGTLRAR